MAAQLFQNPMLMFRSTDNGQRSTCICCQPSTFSKDHAVSTEFSLSRLALLPDQQIAKAAPRSFIFLLVIKNVPALTRF